MNQDKSDTMKGTPVKRPFPPAIDGDLPVPPVPPSSPEAYDEWFRAKVQESLNDVDETIYSHEEVMAAAQVIIDNKRLEKELRERATS